jgi:hypothetical protein
MKKYRTFLVGSASSANPSHWFNYYCIEEHDSFQKAVSSIYQKEVSHVEKGHNIVVLNKDNYIVGIYFSAKGKLLQPLPPTRGYEAWARESVNLISILEDGVEFIAFKEPVPQSLLKNPTDTPDDYHPLFPSIGKGDIYISKREHPAKVYKEIEDSLDATHAQRKKLN